MFLRETHRQLAELDIRLVEADAWLQTSKHGGTVHVRRAARPQRKFVVVRNPKLLGDRELKSLRHNADDRCRLAVDADGGADHARITGEIALPNFVADQRYLLRAGLVVLGVEIASEDRRDAQDLEEVSGDVAARISNRVVLMGNVDRRPIEVAAHHHERLLRGSQVFEILGRRNIPVAVVVLVRVRFRIDQADAGELFGVGKREPAQDERIHHCELRRHAANAEREHGGGKKAEGLLLKRTRRPMRISWRKDWKNIGA
jgi:hypothetical protein